MSRKRTPFDHHIEAITLLGRCDVYLDWYHSDTQNASMAEHISNLRADIQAFINKKYPS